MEFIKQYLLSITAAAIICSLAISLIGKKGAYAAVIKLICGLFLALTAFSPLTGIQITDFSSYLSDLTNSADSAVFAGQHTANEATATIIKSETEAYILDKASSMGLNIEVEVTVSDTSPPAPVCIRISGTISPYAKQQLRSIISSDLGIPEDKQTWI